MDPESLYPVKHRSTLAQADLTMVRARAGLVRASMGLEPFKASDLITEELAAGPLKLAENRVEHFQKNVRRRFDCVLEIDPQEVIRLQNELLGKKDAFLTLSGPEWRYLRNVQRSLMAMTSLCGTMLVSFGLKINRCHPRFQTMNRSFPGLIVQRNRVFVPTFCDSVSY
jgi:hypothetical protein